MATVTKVEKKRTDEWHGVARALRVDHDERRHPDGKIRSWPEESCRPSATLIPIVCDRDNTFRHSKFPMPFVRVADNLDFS